MIDLSMMKGVRVHPTDCTVRVGPGCTQRDVDHATADTRGSESLLAWILLGTLPVVVGLISLFQAIAEARNA